MDTPKVITVEDTNGKWLAYCYNPKIALYGNSSGDVREKVYNMLDDKLFKEEGDAFVIPTDEAGLSTGERLLEVVAKFVDLPVSTFEDCLTIADLTEDILSIED